MICPYCKKEMKKGIIYGDRYKLKWISDEKDKGPIFSPFIKGVDLEKEYNGCISYYCEDDDIVIIDRKELKK